MLSVSCWDVVVAWLLARGTFLLLGCCVSCPDVSGAMVPRPRLATVRKGTPVLGVEAILEDD